MRSFVFGLAAVLWAQTSTAWKWYGYTQERHPDRNIRPVSTLRSSQKGVVRYQNDTVYVMGTYRGSDRTKMELPDTVGSSINPTIPGADDYDRTYLAAYDRHTGAILWWMYFYHSSDSTWGQDMAVASDGTVYLLLIGHPNDDLHWEFKKRNGGTTRGSWDPRGLSGRRASHLLKIQPYQSNPIVAQSSLGVRGPRGDKACDLKHLLLIGDTLLFASGEFHTSVAADLKAVSSSTSSTLFTITSSSNTKNRGLLVRWNLADPDLSSPTAAQLRYEDPPFNNEDVIGHRLAYDPVRNRIRWLVEMQDLPRPSSRPLFYDLSSGGGGSATIFATGLVRTYNLRILSLDTNLSVPPTLDYHNLAQSTSIPLTESPYVFSHNDTVVWALRLGEDASLIDETSPVSLTTTTGTDYALLVEQVLTSGGNDPNLSRYLQIPGASVLSLSGMTVERAGELVYLSGSASGTSWGVGNSLPLGLRDNSRAGFLIGLRRAGPSPSTYRIIGYRPFFSVGASRDSVEVNGMIYNPTQAQFYLLGTAQDSLLMRPVWPLGRADTIRPSPQNNIPERLWVGRLDWYRISASGSYGACVPDTITSSVTVGVSGRNVDITEVPPGTNPGWLFDWLPLATPWQSTAAPLHIMGPIADNSEGTYNYDISPLVAQGQFAPGEYCISGTVVPVLAGRRADIIDTLKLTVTGTTVPAMGRATQTALTYLVAPYAGQMSSTTTITGPYPRHRLENWKFPINITPHYLPYLRGKEALLITSTSAKAVWSIDLMTGLVDSLPLPPNPDIKRYVPDPVRGTYWTIASRTITDNLYQAPPPWGTGDSLLIQRPTGRVTVRRDAYPMRYDSIWVKSIARAAILPHGDIIFFGVSYPAIFDSVSLWRVSLEKDTIYRLTTPNRHFPAGCSQDGMGSAAKVRTPETEIAVCGDTIYWIEKIPNPSCINNDTTYLLRRAYPTSAFPGPFSYQVQTIDTIRLGSRISLRSYLLYTKLPKPALIFGTSNEVVRYQLSTQTRDTLLRCMGGSFLCCEYGLSDWIRGLGGVALLRGGALAVLDGGTVKLAMPIALAGQRDTLLSEGSIISSSRAGGTPVSLGHSQDTLTFDWPDASGPGMDSTYLKVHTTPCTRAMPFFYPFYHLPTFSVNLRGPDTVCVGQVFHTYVQHDTEVVVGTNCRVSLRLFAPATAQQGLVSPLTGGNEIVRWRATQPGYDTIRAELLLRRSGVIWSLLPV
jgi:hypothetical protein